MTKPGLKLKMQQVFSDFKDGVLALRDLRLPSTGMQMGENRFEVLLDGDGNQDPFWRRRDGSAINLTGTSLLVRCDTELTLTQSAQAISGDGDSGNLRILLPDAATWVVQAVVGFLTVTTNPGTLKAELFVGNAAGVGTKNEGETGLALIFPRDDGEGATIS